MSSRIQVATPTSQQKNNRCHGSNTPSTKEMSSAKSASLTGMESQTTSMSGLDNDDNNSKPRYVWNKRSIENCLTTGDKTTVAGVVADKLFPRAKFVDRDTDLMYDGPICKFVTTLCNLQADVDQITWWKQARKWIPTNISRLRNDKSTAMKWAFLGTYIFDYAGNNGCNMLTHI